MVTETFDQGGQPSGTSFVETTTTLTDVGKDSFTLKIESAVEVDGKRLAAPDKEVRQRFNGALDGQTAEVKSLGNETLTLEGRSFPCRVQQFEIASAVSKTVTKAYYCPTAAPYVLKRESTAIDLSNKAVIGHTVLEVIALDMPCKIMGESRTAAHVKVLQKHAKGSEVTLAANSMDVPGGVVWHTYKELDAEGRLLSRSTLELMDYHAAPSPGGPVFKEGRQQRLLPRPHLPPVLRRVR